MAGGSTRRARRLITELVDAGKPIKETGILEPLEDGCWKIHDFERYRAPQKQQQSQATSDERSDAARRAGQASAEARRARNGSAQPRKTEHSQSGFYAVADNQTSNGRRTTPRTDAERTPNDSSNGSRTPVPDPGEEFLPVAAAAKDLTGSARVKVNPNAAAAPASPDISEKVKCPKDLQLSEDHKTQLSAAGVPDYAIAAGVTRFLGKASGDSYGLRTLSAWRNSMYAAVHGMWLDPKQRPNPPESFEKPGPVKANRPAASDVSTYTMPDGRQVRA
jgi:hypothetical protein